MSVSPESISRFIQIISVRTEPDVSIQPGIRATESPIWVLGSGEQEARAEGAEARGKQMEMIPLIWGD